jgi:transposase
MDASSLLSLGLGLEPPWKLVDQRVDTSKTPHEVYLEISSDRGALSTDETASKRRHNYVTVFIDLDKKKKPVIFATPGKGKKCLDEFRSFLKKHGGKSENIVEMVCDMSPAFLAAIGDNFPKANVTVDWFHVVQLFTKAVDQVRKAEAKQHALPKATRWAVLKAADGGRLTKKQQKAFAELETGGFATTTAWRIKEMLRWVRKAETVRAAKWRITHFFRHALKCIAYDMQNLVPVLKALITLEEHAEMILQRWASTYSNARLEGLNGIFQAARARARGYRNQLTFITMIYFIAAPLGKLIEFHT